MAKNKGTSGFHHKKGLGQNFIENDDLLAHLVSLSGVTKEDSVLEIGPGMGGMTVHLAEAARQVITVEVDETLLPFLRVALEKHDNVTIVEGDALRLNLPEIAKPLGKGFHLVANIPYYITTPLLQLFLSGSLPLSSISVMVQLEVAEKMLAGPGDEGYGLLAIRCQYYGIPAIAAEVPAACFTPPPKVDSAFVVMPMRKKPPVDVADEGLFFRMVKAAFAMRRKTMQNNLQAAFSLGKEEAGALLADAGLDMKVRGEKLSLQDFANLANRLSERRAVQK